MTEIRKIYSYEDLQFRDFRVILPILEKNIGVKLSDDCSLEMIDLIIKMAKESIKKEWLIADDLGKIFQAFFTALKNAKQGGTI